MWLFKKKEYNSDEDLLFHYKQSENKELFSDLFKKHVAVVYGTCLFYLQDKDLAQDATMQLFEKMMLEVKNHEVKNFKAWLSFVVRNHCISIIRKNKTYQKNLRSYGEFEYEETSYEVEEKIQSVDDEKMLSLMNESLPKLKEKQRICVELFYLKNKSYQEISEATKYTINEVKSYIQNGKRNLKLLIEEQISLNQKEKLRSNHA